jgi:hypothetical protein
MASKQRDRAKERFWRGAFKRQGCSGLSVALCLAADPRNTRWPGRHAMERTAKGDRLPARAGDQPRAAAEHGQQHGSRRSGR